MVISREPLLFVRVLEIVFEADLDVASPLRAIGKPQVAAEIAVWRVKNGRVRDIDEFATHFQILLLKSREDLRNAEIYHV